MRRIGVMIVLVLLAGVPFSAGASDPATALKIAPVKGVDGTPAFQMRALDGREIDSANLKGKVVVLNFWATWCGPCKEEMPALERLRRQVDGDKVVLAAVTTDMQRDGIRAFIAQLGLGFPVWLDEDRSVSAAFLVRGLPTTVFIGADGRVAGRAVGPRDWDSPEAVAFVKSLEHSK
jgi:thiol-disulfide isomerase/thioredoxin